MPMIDIQGTGDNIRRVMADAGKTAKDIQEPCGFTTCNAVYKWLGGQCMPSIDSMVIIAFACGVTINDIVATR